jgi:hypothetical protein
VPEKMVDRLMRHKGRTEYRYYDPPLDEQARELAKLPRLWPESGRPKVGDGGPIVDNPGNSTLDLTTPPLRADDVPGSQAPLTQTSTSTRCHPAPLPLDCQEERECSGRHPVDAALRAALRGRRQTERRVESRPITNPETTFSGFITRADSNDALADLLDALARLLRSGAVGHDGRGEPPPPKAG